MAELAIAEARPCGPSRIRIGPGATTRTSPPSNASCGAASGAGSPSRDRMRRRSRSAFAAYQGARHGVLMANGTVTMEVALKALGIGWGDEVIVPALTFAATAYAPIAAGALPVFVDVTPETWTIDPTQVEAAITPRTRAIMPVHLGHQMADMDRLMEIADRARAGGRRGLRPRARAAVERRGRRLHRRLRLVQPSVLEDPDRRGGRHAPDERRRARAARALAHRLRARRRTTTRRSTRSARTTGWASCTPRCWWSRWSGSPRSRTSARSNGTAFEGLAADGARRAGHAARRAHHALELLQLHPGDRPRCVRRRGRTSSCATRWRPRASRPRSSTRR